MMCKCGRHDESEYFRDCEWNTLNQLNTLVRSLQNPPESSSTFVALEKEMFAETLMRMHDEKVAQAFDSPRCEACDQRPAYIEDVIDGYVVGVLCKECATEFGVLQ